MDLYEMMESTAGALTLPRLAALAAVVLSPAAAEPCDRSPRGHTPQSSSGAPCF